jgi:hypothetical protein
MNQKQRSVGPYMWSANHDWKEIDVYKHIIRTAAGDLGIRISKEQMNELVQRMVDLRKEGDYISGQTGEIMKRTDGLHTKGSKKTFSGYYIAVPMETQEEILAIAKDMGIKKSATDPKETPKSESAKDSVPRNPQGTEKTKVEGDGSGTKPSNSNASKTDYNTEDYRKMTVDLEEKAAALQKKFEAIDAFYQGKNQRHGLGGYYNEYLSNAEEDVNLLQNARNNLKLKNAQSQQAGEGAVSSLPLAETVARAERRLKEFPGDASKMTPEQITEALNKEYNQQFDTWKYVAEWVGTIPTPATRGVEFGMKFLANSLHVWSGDIDRTQFAAETMKDGAKFLVGTYSKNAGQDGTVSKLLSFVENASTNTIKELTDARADLIKNPNQDPLTVYKSAFARGITGAVTDSMGDSIKLVEKFGGGAEGVKNFSINFVKESISEYTSVQKELAKSPNADSSQLYKEAAARALVKSTASAAGKSIESIAGDDEALKFLYKAANKLGIDEQVKKYLDAQKSLATPLEGEKKTNLQSQAVPTSGIAGSESFKNMVASAEKLILPGDVSPSNVAIKALEMAAKEGVNASRIIQSAKDQNVLAAVDPNLNIRTSPFTIQDVRLMDTSMAMNAVEQQQLKAQQNSNNLEQNSHKVMS